jgi:hypothetical protein
VLVIYGKVLEIVGQAINQLSGEWREEIPPLTIFSVSGGNGEPSRGVDGFLKRYLTKSTSENLIQNTRSAMNGYRHNWWLVIETRSIGRVFVHKCADSRDTSRVHASLQRNGLTFPFDFNPPLFSMAADN